MKNPLSAALFAAVVTAATVYFTNKEKEKQKNSIYTKPALSRTFSILYSVFWEC